MTTDPLQGEFERRGFQRVMRSTANFWGYSAKWEIRDGRLWLTGLDGQQAAPVTDPSTGRQSVQRFELDPVELFGCELPVAATWYTGSLHPERGLVNYVHAAWESSFAERRHVEVASGQLVRLDPPQPNQRFDPSALIPPPAPRWWQRLLRR